MLASYIGKEPIYVSPHSQWREAAVKRPSQKHPSLYQRLDSHITQDKMLYVAGECMNSLHE